ncbi:AMP-binding protein [Halodurantibacterium flavum]|uniref:AMP-binding protein n=1 Tax=Halodurantibacterium flavum TaxID=1382802 RepID=A0ABW4S128_9RHOB
MADLLRDFAAAVARHPDRVALIDGRGRQTSFGALRARSEAFAAAWQRKGIRPGHRVLLAMSVDADLYAALAALWSLGATVVLPEPAMGLAGFRHAARVTRPEGFCSSGAFGLLKWVLPGLWGTMPLRPASHPGPLRDAPGREVSGEDGSVALISFTSGTGGAPKAIPRSHDFLDAQHRAVAPLLESDRADERDLVAFPVFVLINLAAGRTSVLPNWRMSRIAALPPDRLRDWIERQGVTRALIPPSLCEKLAVSGVPPQLDRVFTGGGPVFPDLVDRLRQAAPHLRLTCVYGSTEAEPIAHLDTADLRAADETAMDQGQGLLVGHPVAGILLRIEKGEIQVAGAHVNGGYLDPAQDAETKIREGGTLWHRTGDAGHLDGQGRLWLLGRVGSEVEIDGQTVHPFSVEITVRRWPGVRNCALMAEEGRAVLFIDGDAENARQWQERAASLGIGRVIRVDRMPMDRRHASKIDRKALRDWRGR